MISFFDMFFFKLFLFGDLLYLPTPEVFLTELKSSYFPDLELLRALLLFLAVLTPVFMVYFWVLLFVKGVVPLL